MELALSRALRLSSNRYKASTLEVMASRWRKFCEASFDHRTPEGWLNERGLAQTLAKFPAFTTRKRHFLLFKWVTRTLIAGGTPVPDPTPSFEKEFEGEQRTFHTVAPLETQSDRLAAHARESVRGWKGTRLVAIVRLLGDTGLRSEDVRLLKVFDVRLDQEPGLVTLTQKNQQPRTLELSPVAVSALKDWLAARPVCPGNLLFVADFQGGPLDPATLWRQLKRLDEAVGPTGAPLSGTTAIRAAYAQQLRDKGASPLEIQQALGHRKLSSTMELLDRITRSQRRRKAAQAGEPPAGSSDRSTSS